MLIQRFEYWSLMLIELENHLGIYWLLSPMFEITCTNYISNLYVIAKLNVWTIDVLVKQRKNYVIQSATVVYHVRIKCIK